MEFTVQQIAEVLGGTVEGDATRRVTGLAKIEEAQAGALAFLSNPKYEHFLYDTQASAVIVSPDLVLRHAVATSLVRVADPYSAFTKLLEFYAQATRMGKRGVEEPAYLAATATVGPGHYRGAFSYIGENCQLGPNVLVFPHAYIGDRVTIGEGSVIHAGAKIYPDTVIGRFCVVKAGAVVGTDGFGFAPQPDGSYLPIPQIGNVVLGDYVSIGANTTVDCATMGTTRVGEGSKIDNLVQVGHNVEIGRHTVIAGQTGISGSTKIGDYCLLGGQVGIAGHITLANKTTLAAQTGVHKSVKGEGRILQGRPALDLNQSQRVLVVYRNLPAILHRVERLEQTANAPEKP
ncbi:UDP-3-O-(3-hydroxymyristoyl)glucosamine N-acyltransferase [Hymenobacter sp. PAMC 26628]|uniref:UDP-3-O-(3-hydroxymyristoyl)glucosamine N-acyltransferase n=1 Tax=Hymenobacter sp. PAMC 26628 TaxID=1484118 RepID=UPI0007705979|nr:UDP-3-O-(3-hydroxymyristoyl)glucosamine N-acyltransferase [Hymenobacter sp. PAMC 26628]AMJ65510.1 UDP-3-O-(3-hydroxymyristoyl)glucosamine N-acyltransferase [Hymenobacter sp. PAMC 26628]